MPVSESIPSLSANRNEKLENSFIQGQSGRCVRGPKADDLSSEARVEVMNLRTIVCRGGP